MLLKTEVTFFIKVFVENKKEYQSMHELDLDIDHYKKMEGIHLVICTSSSHSRIYRCGSYVDCSCKAKFGRIRKMGIKLLSRLNGVICFTKVRMHQLLQRNVPTNKE